MDAMGKEQPVGLHQFSGLGMPITLIKYTMNDDRDSQDKSFSSHHDSVGKELALHGFNRRYLIDSLKKNLELTESLNHGCKQA